MKKPSKQTAANAPPKTKTEPWNKGIHKKLVAVAREESFGIDEDGNGDKPEPWELFEFHPDVKVGTPTKYKPEYAKEIVEWIRKTGADEGIVGWCAYMKIGRDTLKNWCVENPDFLLARLEAQQIHQRAMIKLGQRGQRGKLPHGAWQAAWMFTMRCQHGWSEDNVDDQEESDLGFK